MKDRELDDILKKALTPQNEIREEEILVQNRKREEKTMRRKRAKKFWVPGLRLLCWQSSVFFHRHLLRSR